jgi:(1->4)-alpha-D-glucan 1-alpha-D-glucosylmutase
MKVPASTYRVQLHKDFTFEDLESIVDYLHTLGVSTIYAAPIVRAVPGSMHGYDVVDPHAINPEVGNLETLQRIAGSLKEKKMTWLQDIVPNHMAFHTLNHRLMDVLERGHASPYYNYFDINWQHYDDRLKGKLQVPFLGKELEDCIESDELKISFTERGFTVDYFQTSFPLSVSACEILFEDNAVDFGFNFRQFIRENLDAGYSQWKKAKDNLVRSVLSNEKKHFSILELLESVNRDKLRLHEVLNTQYYALVFWKHSEWEMGYRRFFTVNELICLRMEDEAVFNEYHTFFNSLYKDQLIQGLRIDHIDGLKDPFKYVSTLRKRFGDDCYIIAEKILEAKEEMPAHWPLQGTSGYEFLSHISQLITNRKGAKQLLDFYKELIPSVKPYSEVVLTNKKLILERYMGGEWDNLVHDFMRLDLSANFPQDKIKKALGYVMVCLPVYRIYPEKLPLTGKDIMVMKETFEKAVKEGPESKAVLEYLLDLFTTPQEAPGASDRVLCFLQRLMQFTGPLTAKGVEDTTFYIYNPLISHDEVGDSPSTLGISIANFHTKMASRQSAAPLSLSATATHDTKRGEDARLRLNILSLFPDDWKALVVQWMDVNKNSRKKTSKGKVAPLINDEYYIYQSIVGGFPEDMNVTAEWISRLQAYITKVVREAKVNSDWADPDQEYEEACSAFVGAILTPDSEFLRSIVPFIRKVTGISNRYAIAQTLIKITAPGIPDIYQGCELWDLSFVDPDNRRPVDYRKRKTFLDQLIQKEKEGAHVLFPFLEDHRNDGIEKLFVTWKSLTYRKKNPILFTDGKYIPLQVTGRDIITVAYARNQGENWVLVIVPLRIREKHNDPSDIATDDEIILPDNAPNLWRNVFTGEMTQTQGRLPLSACITRFSVALFTNS